MSQVAAIFPDGFKLAPVLLALPLAAMPVLLHLLFRRKSPVVLFSTLRFIRTSLQHTAARRRIQRWLLLAIRVLLLALLIWAVAQPVQRLSANWSQDQRSLALAIVVDTSYSMLYETGQKDGRPQTLLTQADGLIRQVLTAAASADAGSGGAADSEGRRLLQQSLHNAKVAVFRSQADPPEQAPHLQPAGELSQEWKTLEPGPADEPLEQRIGAAMAFLSRQDADRKWLVVISDMQSREFPHPMTDLENAAADKDPTLKLRVLAFDLHPEDAGSAGITNVRIEPQQPLPGLPSRLTSEAVGRTSRIVSPPTVAKFDPASLRWAPVATKWQGAKEDERTGTVAFDNSGHGTVQFVLPKGLPPERWLQVTESFETGDLMSWDDQRSTLVEMPPRRKVTLLGGPDTEDIRLYAKLALDPSEGQWPNWPLSAQDSADLAGGEQTVVLPMTEWPDAAHLDRLSQFVHSGGTLILFLRPGLEQTWKQLSDAQKKTLKDLLPAEPTVTDIHGGSWLIQPAVVEDPLLEGLTDKAMQMGRIVVHRFVPFPRPQEAAVTTLLGVFNETPGARRYGLLFRRVAGEGQVYTLGTFPVDPYSILAKRPMFLPLMVRMSMRPMQQSNVQNVEIGQPLTLAGPQWAAYKEMEIVDPDNQSYVEKALGANTGPRFMFNGAKKDGIYVWRPKGSKEVVAMTNVQLPAGESDLEYTPASTLFPAGPNVMVVRSWDDLKSEMQKTDRPQWAGPIALVLLLLCFEALLGSMSQLWKPMALRNMLAGWFGKAPEPQREAA